MNIPGITTPIPKDYDKQKWLQAGCSISKFYVDGDITSQNSVQAIYKLNNLKTITRI